MLQLNIPNPCGESLADMTPTERGRFCAACQREILDFTHYSDEQLYRYILTASENGQSPCGYFRPDQLSRPLAPASRTGAYAHTWRALGLLMAGLMGAQNLQAQANTKTIENPVEVRDTIPNWDKRPRFIEGMVRDSSIGTPVIYCRVEINGLHYYYANTDENGYFKIALSEDEPNAVIKVKAQALGYRGFQTTIDNPEAVLPVNLVIRLESSLEIVAHNWTRLQRVTGVIIVSKTYKMNAWQRLKYFFKRKRK